MANTDKRIYTGIKSLHSVLTDAFMSIPEFVNNPYADPKEIITNFLEKSGKEIFRTAVRTKREPYQDFYLTSKNATKKLANMAVAEISKFTDLSPESIKKIGAAAGVSIEAFRKGEVEIPSTRLVDRNGFTVDAGGYANIPDDVYRAKLAGQIENPLGIEGLTVRGKAEGSFDRPFENVNVGGSYQVGDASTLSFGVDPINESARLGFKTTWKKGGKVKKKRKTKKYAKGCAVRTAKY